MNEGSQWITAHVELPQIVLDAHAEKRVVFFVGAGASVDPPSKLPLFKDLAILLGDEAGVSYDDRQLIDHFLGQLTHLTRPYPVHERTHFHLTPATSEHNRMHAAIVNLAAAYGYPRIVTTNFDDHLDSAARAAGITFSDRWTGPALPLGDDVAGLVHLHGSIRRGANSFVLTDKDLGIAYLTDAWATRFLLKLFQSNVVVFIGYGLTDPTLRYLTLGLPAGAALYAFTRSSEASDPDWKRLGVQTIAFGDDYANLPAALEAWDIRARMGQLDHQTRVNEIVAAGTTLTPVDGDYLRIRLQTADGVDDFVNAAGRTSHDSKLEWLRWLESLPEFKSAFTSVEVTDPVAKLGRWFAETFIAVPELHGAALQVVQRAGQTMSANLFKSACWLAEALSENDRAAGRRWLAVLSTSIFGHSTPVEPELILPSIPGVDARSISVLRSTLRPYLQLKKRWLLDGSSNPATALPAADVTWRADERALTHHLRLAIETADPDEIGVGEVLESALLSAYELLNDYHGDRPWDPLAYNRSAIESHEQDSLRDPVDAVIDALRDFGQSALPHRPNLPDRWWDLEKPLFRRLALHLVAVDGSRQADDKITWTLKRTGLYSAHLKHELFHILSVAASGASDDVRQRVLEAVAAGPSYSDTVPDSERLFAYEKYNLLVWLTKSAPQWEDAQDALRSAQEENPTFGPREHPDFDSWMTSGTWGGNPPMTVEEFRQAVRDDPGGALSDLLSRDYSERAFDGPTWRDALELVGKSVGQDVEHGQRLWDQLDNRGYLDGRANDLRLVITEAWGESDLGHGAAEIVRQVATLVSDPRGAQSIARFLRDQVRIRIEEDETPSLAEMRELAVALWVAQGSLFTHSDADPLSIAPLYLNSWPGFLSQYWLSEIDRRWRHHRDGWDGLSSQEGDALVAMLSAHRQALDAVQPALSSELYFLFVADEQFTSTSILPIFADERDSKFAWHPYLFRPRYNDKLLAAGLLDATISEWDRLNEIGERALLAHFFGLVASIASFAGITADSRRSLLRQSVLAADGEHAAQFAESVARFVGEDEIDGAEVWTLWLGGHVADRLNGIPRSASTEELTKWANVVPAVGHCIPAAVAVFSGRNIGFGEEHFSIEFPGGVLRDYGDELVQFLSDRVRNSESGDMMLKYKIGRLVDTVRSGVREQSVAQPLVEAAASKGYLDGDH